MALYPYTINPSMVYEPSTLLGFISSLRLSTDREDVVTANASRILDGTVACIEVSAANIQLYGGDSATG